MTLNTLAARIGVEKKKKRARKASKAAPAEKSVSHLEYLQEALKAIENGDIVQIDQHDYKAQIKQLSKQLAKRN